MAAPQPLHVERLPPVAAGVRVNTIAIVPFASAPQVDRPGAPVVDVEDGGIAIVSARVVEALSEVGDLAVTPPEETARWLEANGRALQDSPARLGSELASAFGADAILYGRVRRYRSRIGSTRGASRPASVWFELELRLPDGVRIWAGSYDEQQEALSENLLSLPRAADRGFAWVDASRLSSDGARALVAALLEERRHWR
jgi:hypothetical protein